MNINKKTKEIIFGILFLGILVLVGLNASLYSLRIDATENRMFSIHPVSQNLFKNIPQQVRITYYLTEKLKTTDPVYGEIEDIVREYAAHANGKIVVNVIDPTRDNKVQEAQEFGIEQFDAGRQAAVDEANIFLAYSGIVIEYLDRHKVITRIGSVDTLEYELSSKIRALVSNRTKKIGYLVDDQSFNMQEFANVVQYLQREYDVQEIKRGEDIPAALDAVFVIGGLNLTDFDLYPIDQYLMRGGRVFFATGAVRVNMQYNMAIPADKSPLLDMLKNYGAVIQPHLIMEQPQLALPTQAGRYNYFFITVQDFVSRDNPITAHFQPVYFFWASPLEYSVTPAIKAETLVATSPRAVAVKQDFRLNPQEASLMYRVYAGEGSKSLPVVAALSGNFTSYFKGKQIPTQEGAARDWTKTEDLSSPTRVIVAGDANFLAPGYLTAANFAFFVNCLSWLANDDDLLAIRTRAQRDPSMLKIEDPEARRTATTIIKLVNWVGLPLIVIAFGVFNFIRRRKKRTA